MMLVNSDGQGWVHTGRINGSENSSKQNRELLVALVVSIVLCISIWSFAFWYTGVKFDYRADETSGFLALRLAPDAGLSYQWSDKGQSIWYWTAARNIRVWPQTVGPQ